MPIGTSAPILEGVGVMVTAFDLKTALLAKHAKQAAPAFLEAGQPEGQEWRIDDCKPGS